MENTVNARILLTEDDTNLGYLLVENLKSKGFDVTLAQSGNAAADLINRHKYDLYILDIMLPELDGFSLAHRIKKQHPQAPFIFLTARTQDKDKLQGFETGADDYITKPFIFKELYYRINVIMRRNSSVVAIHNPVIHIGNLTLHKEERILVLNEKETKLSQRENMLLAILLENYGQYVKRSEILERVWGSQTIFAANSMDVYLNRVRKLLKEEPNLEIENLYGNGYRIRHLGYESYLQAQA